jgi:hypothetical protein
MNKTRIVYVFVLATLALLFAHDSFAAFYKYVDDKGVVSFSDNLQSVPEKYRATAVVINDGTGDDEAKAITKSVVNKAVDAPSSTVESTPGKTSDKERTSVSSRLLLSLGVVLSSLFIFFVAGKLTDMRENKKFLSVMRGILITLVSIYLVYAHASDVAGVFSMASHAVDDVKHHSEEKGKKATRAIKSLDTLFEEGQKAQKTSVTDPADTEK